MIDVHESLSKLVKVAEDDPCMELMSMQLESGIVMIENSICDHYPSSVLDWNQYHFVNDLIIGDSNFQNVGNFQIDGLDQLTSLKIGKNSFTKNKNSHGNDSSRSFHISNCIELQSIEIHISNCIELQSIEIDNYSFSDYGGEFELKNLPSLISIKMGSYNFHHSSFKIKGILIY